MKKYNRKIDVIIPAYNVPDKILSRCLASIACQNIVDELEITIVDDASTEQNYLEVINNFKSMLKINLMRYEENGGPGIARQYGLDHTVNGYVTFIDADDTLNGSFALDILRQGLEIDNGLYHTCVGCFDEVHEEGVLETMRPYFIPHREDMVWMFGKLYRRSFLDKYKIHFHPTSRANEDNGFNTMIRLCSGESERVNFINFPVYYWHENPNSITRINDCQYSYGASKRDSFYGYVENMIFAIKEAKSRKPYNGMITMWSVICMLNLYQYYIECYARSPENVEQNFKWCKWYYDEVYSLIEKDISEEILAKHYTDLMRDSYHSEKLEGIIPCMGIYEFLKKLKEE